ALCERDPKRALQLLDDPDRCPPALHDFAWAHLRRLCHREDRVYADHGTGRELYAVAYSPDGALVATGRADGPIRAWGPRTARAWGGGQRRPSGDARPRRQVKVPGAKGGAVLCVAFHPDPKRQLLVTGSTDGADVWSAEKSVASKVRVRWGTGPVRAVAFSPD